VRPAGNLRRRRARAWLSCRTVGWGESAVGGRRLAVGDCGWRMAASDPICDRSGGRRPSKPRSARFSDQPL